MMRGMSIKEMMEHIQERATQFKQYDGFSLPDYDSDAENTIFNKPIENNLGLGWGGHWYKYGFDEKFLKAVVFPYFAQRGEVISILNDKHEKSLKYLWSDCHIKASKSQYLVFQAFFNPRHCAAGKAFMGGYTVKKKFSGIPVPSRDVTYRTLPGRK